MAEFGVINENENNNTYTNIDKASIAAVLVTFLTQIAACTYAGYKLNSHFYTGNSTPISILAGIGIGAAAYFTPNLISGIVLQYTDGNECKINNQASFYDYAGLSIFSTPLLIGELVNKALTKASSYCDR